MPELERARVRGRTMREARGVGLASKSRDLAELTSDEPIEISIS
jgi:hypothetical protein